MADLRLTLASGLALTIPARTVRTLQSGIAGADTSGGAVIRYRIGSDLRTRVLQTPYDDVVKMLNADKSARKDLFEVETDAGQRFSFFPSDADAIEDLDPEAPASRGCSALIDLKIDGDDAFVLCGLYAKADPAEIRAAREPAQPSDVVAATPRARGGRRAH
jgi:hypothetical protein